MPLGLLGRSASSKATAIRKSQISHPTSTVLHPTPTAYNLPSRQPRQHIDISPIEQSDKLFSPLGSNASSKPSSLEARQSPIPKGNASTPGSISISDSDLRPEPLSVGKEEEVEEEDLKDVDLDRESGSEKEFKRGPVSIDSNKSENSKLNLQSFEKLQLYLGGQSKESSTYSEDTKSAPFPIKHPRRLDDTEMPDKAERVRGPSRSIGLIVSTIIGIVAVVAFVIALMFGVSNKNAIRHIEGELYVSTAEEVLSIPPTLLSTLPPKSTEGALDATKVILVTSYPSLGEQRTSRSTSTSFTITSSTRRSSSSSRYSIPPTIDGIFLDDPVKRNGYFHQQNSALIIEPGPIAAAPCTGNIAYVPNLTGRGVESSDCDLTTITTTLTTTITRPSRRPRASSTITSNSALITDTSISLSIIESTSTKITTLTTPITLRKTIFQSFGTPSHDEPAIINSPDVPSTVTPIQSTAEPPHEPGTTALTLPPTDIPPHSTSIVTSVSSKTAALDRSKSVVILNPSATAAAARLAAPPTWIKSKLRRFIPEHDRNLLPPIVPTMTPMPRTTETAHVLSHTSTNAAVRPATMPWKHSANKRREDLERKLNHWEAYTQLRLQVVQLCFDTRTYVDSTLTPPAIQTEEDLEMGAALNEKLCDILERKYPPAIEEGKCEKKDEWQDMKVKIEEICALERLGTKLVQGVQLLCDVKTVLEGNIEDCDADASTTSDLSGKHSTTYRFATGTEGSTNLGGSTAGSVVTMLSLVNQGLTNSVSQLTAGHRSSFVEPITTSPITSTIPNRLSTPHATSPIKIPEISSSHATIPVLTYTASLPYTLLTTNISLPTGTEMLNSATPSYKGVHTTWSVHQSFPVPTGYFSTLVPAAEQTGHLSSYNGNYNTGYPKCSSQSLIPLRPNELAVAVSWLIWELFEGDEDDMKLCNQRIEAKWTDYMGEQRRAMFGVRDKCEGYRPEDIDILEPVFDQIVAPTGVGRVMVKWGWVGVDEAVEG